MANTRELALLRAKTLMQLVAERIADKVLEQWLAEDSPARPARKPASRVVGNPDPLAVSKCPKCPKRFRNLRGVEVHLARMHKGEP